MTKTNISLKVSNNGEDRLKVTWIDMYGASLHYDIYRTLITNVGKECCELLNQLTQTFGSELNPNYEAILLELAKKGNDLYFLLFDGCAGNNPMAAEAKAWLSETEKGGIKLTVCLDTTAHIPWGLVYDSDIRSLPDNAGSVDEFKDFWAIKYSVSALYTLHNPRVLTQTCSRESFKILSALNREEYQRVQGLLKEDEFTFLDTFLERDVGKAFTSERCRQLWEKVGDNECLIYFYCHSNGRELVLSEEEKIGVLPFRRLFSKESEILGYKSARSNSLVFLNGCKTAIGNLDDNFLTATVEPGFCGFIGSEADLPAEFATRFGLALLYCLFDEGLLLQDAMDKLRRQHWPLGLLYGCYAHPAFHIGGSQEPTQAPGFIDDNNFSVGNSTN